VGEGGTDEVAWAVEILVMVRKAEAVLVVVTALRRG
jgi:hypothetical protein